MLHSSEISNMNRASTHQNNMAKAKDQSVPAPLVAAIAVIVIALVGFFGFRMLSGPSYPKVPSAKQLYSQADQLALKSGGDFSKLSTDEQTLLNNLTAGHGQKYIELHYAKLAGTGGK